MGSLGNSSSGLWSALGQASSVAQLVGVDALGLVSMVVQAALAARRHRDACRRLAQHVDLVGGLLLELELSELMRREATRRPLEQLGGALRRCYALVKACQDCGGFLPRLFLGARMAEELRAAEKEIDMFIRLVPLIALVDTSHNRRAKATEEAPCVITSCSNHRSRLTRRAEELSNLSVQGAVVPCKVGEEFFEDFSGIEEQHKQKVMDVDELVKLCSRTEASCPGFKSFDFLQIVDATDNFSDKRIVGRGGFGTVYKGQFTDGTMVAIKRLEEHAGDFTGELQLAHLQHINIIRLLGWCVHGKERILAYEFMHNGSLDQIIFDRTKATLLNWHKRFQIIKGLAEGLTYMHKKSLLWIVHGDLKPNNILLDHNMRPKIADFGSAITLSSGIAMGCTRRIVGTSGYMAPEYASRGLYSVKIDVFGFGVLALVIISGRKNRILEQQGDAVGNLVRDAWKLWKDGRLHELVDPVLGVRYELAEIVQCAKVALLCAQEDPADRPTMSDVVSLLGFESTSLLPDPKPPSELIRRDATDADELSTYNGESSRTIDITIKSSAPLTATRLRIIIEPET